MKDNELKIMKHLRVNARESLTKMSRTTGIPVSTIYERLKLFEKSVIKKHTCLIDFQKLGYDLRVTLLVKVKQNSKDSLQRCLLSHHLVNMVFRINNGYDYLIEAVFQNMAQVQEFMELLDKKGISSHKEFFVLEELKREAFLTSDAHIDFIKSALS